MVLTTDHAQLTGETFYGLDGVNRGNFNWYYGSDADETYRTPSPEIQKLIRTGGTGDNGTDGNMPPACRTRPSAPGSTTRRPRPRSRRPT